MCLLVKQNVLIKDMTTVSVIGTLCLQILAAAGGAEADVSLPGFGIGITVASDQPGGKLPVAQRPLKIFSKVFRLSSGRCFKN
jgi:hypothetical protein